MAEAPIPDTPFRFIWQVARGRFRHWLLALGLAETANAFCGIMVPYALGRIIGKVTADHASAADVFASLRGPLTLFAALCLGELIFSRTSGAIQARIAPQQRQGAARRLFRHLQLHSHRYLNENFAGALANRIGEASHGVNQVLWSLLTEFWPIAITIVVANVLLMRTHALLGMVAAAWSVCFISLSFYLSKKVQPLSASASNARSKTVGQVVDAVSNHSAVRLFAKVDYECERLDRRYAEELKPILTANISMERVRIFQFSASALLKAGTLFVAVHLWSRGEIQVGQFVMTVSLILLILSEVRNLSRRFLEFFESIGNVASGVKAIAQPHELTDGDGAKALLVDFGQVVFRNVDFGYVPETRIFHGLSVAIPAGQRVGLVGLSGSGKSTFTSLLLRLYDPQSGSISIDGHELRGLTQASLHAQVGLIPQDPTLFHRTLRENIRYGRIDATDAEVEDAARRAFADEFIREAPGGYDALVGERGIKLSGGQRQRIAIARVILKNAPILILDEATSSLDSLTEHAIQTALDEIMIGKTVIVIAHRLSTIAHLDRILVFSNGRIVEDGNHPELLARRGEYHSLWLRQSGGLLPEESAAHQSGGSKKNQQCCFLTSLLRA
jgi:ATP-binding cassette, subfamily B, bacterial